MTLVDSGVWIDYFAGRRSLEVDWLDNSLETGVIVVGDLVLVEVLQGCRYDREFDRLHAALTMRPLLRIADEDVVVAAARNYRTLRAMGITIRKTIDTLIATRCIFDRIPLLYSDRDFDPFVEHLGLVPALPATSGASK